jgi:phosphopantothenoylcysteine decarboxylase/phosphopantothenate--cysteine ligase
MYDAVLDTATDADIIIKAAAVADYTPLEVKDNKIKKSNDDMTIPLKRTDDIIGTLGKLKNEFNRKQFLCGFSMETENMLENSRAKLEKKNLDMIVANNVKVEGAGFATDTNVVTFITRDGTEELPIMSKAEVAHELLTRIRKVFFCIS